MQYHFDPAGAMTQFVGTLPTFIAVILAWMHSNGRFSDVHQRINDTNQRMGDLRTEMRELRADMREAIHAEGVATRAEFRRVEEVMDNRLKPIEKRLG